MGNVSICITVLSHEFLYIAYKSEEMAKRNRNRKEMDTERGGGGN